MDHPTDSFERIGLRSPARRYPFVTKMQEVCGFVILRFMGDVSIAPGTSISAERPRVCLLPLIPPS